MLEHSGLGSVLPGRGLGDIRLGMRPDDVRAVGGEPVRACQSDADGDATMELLGGVFLYFSWEEDFRLTLILLEDASALTSCGVPITRSSETELLLWLGDAAYAVRQTEFLGADGEVAIEREHDFRELGITLYAGGGGALTGCAIFVVIDAGDGFRWPDGR